MHDRLVKNVRNTRRAQQGRHLLGLRALRWRAKHDGAAQPERIKLRAQAGQAAMPKTTRCARLLSMKGVMVYLSRRAPGLLGNDAEILYPLPTIRRASGVARVRQSV